MNRADRSVRHASGWQLIALFFTALLVFVSWRWQPEPWLRSTLEEALHFYHMTLHYQKLETAGLAIRLDDVHISSDTLPVPLHFDTIRLAPDWLSLLQLKPAADLALSWHGVTLHTTLSRTDQAIELADIHVQAGVAVLAAQWSGMLPVQPDGELLVTGTLYMDPATGRPLNGSLQGVWQQASLLFAGTAEALGNYTLKLKNDAASNPWQWQLGGGEGVVVNGTGTFLIPSGLPQQWQLAGELGLTPGPSLSPPMKAMLQQPLHFSVAGSLAAPRLQPR